MAKNNNNNNCDTINFIKEKTALQQQQFQSWQNFR